MTVRQFVNFKITFKDKTYETPSFDHVFPTKEINIVNKINSFAKQTKKIKDIQDEIVDESHA
jgi:hypothetical protein